MKPQVESTIFNLSLRIFNALLRREHLLRSIALALPISCVYFTVMVVGVLRVGPIEYMRFLQRNPYAKDRDALVGQLKDSFSKINKYEAEAFQNHQQLADKLMGILKNSKRSDDLENALRLSQENQDAVRALLQLGGFYKDMATANALTPQHHQLLIDLYSAIILVMLDTEESLKEALVILEALAQQKGLTPAPLEALPQSIKPLIKLERLRYLTFITAQLGKAEKQQRYTYEANQLREQLRKPSQGDIDSDYRLRWYWIDLSDLILNAKGSSSAPTQSERESKRKQADRAFETLLHQLGCGSSSSRNEYCSFLTTRMLRHRNAVKRNPQQEVDEVNEEINKKTEELWNDYINRIPAETKPLHRQP